MGMYCIPQARRIPHDIFKKHLEKHGYHPVQFTAIIWNHKSIHISFTLIFDRFAIKYVGKQHAEHFIQSFQ